MTHIWISLLLLTTVLESTRGTLCIGEERCVETIGTSIAVVPADRERSFVWTSAGDATVRLGVIAPKAATAVLDANEVSAIELAIDGDRTAGWPAADASTCATANEQGAFGCELSHPLPEAIVANASGYGPRELWVARDTG